MIYLTELIVPYLQSLQMYIKGGLDGGSPEKCWISGLQINLCLLTTKECISEFLDIWEVIHLNHSSFQRPTLSITELHKMTIEIRGEVKIVTVQGKSKLMEGGIKLGYPLDCHIYSLSVVTNFPQYFS